MGDVRQRARRVIGVPALDREAQGRAAPRAVAGRASSALADLQARADRSAPVAQLAACQAHADQRAVVQAIGWEDLGAANPRRYLPAPLGYTPEQMVENGLWPAPVEEDEEEGETLEERPEEDSLPDLISEDTGEVPAQNQRGRNFDRNHRKRQKKKQKALERRLGETGSGGDAKKKVKRGKQEEEETSEEESSAEEEPQMLSEESEDEGFTLVSYAKKPRSEEAQQLSDERAHNRDAVERNRFLSSWIASPDQSGTRGLQGQGSSAAHDYEAQGKAAAKAGNIGEAIECLQDAIRERKSDPNMKRNPDPGHRKAVTFLENLIEALQRIG